MDFLNMNFSVLFLERHGRTIYENICKKIRLESLSEYNENYLESIFDIAYLKLWGMEDTQILHLLRDIGKIDNIDIKKVQEIHKNSIRKIQEHIEIAITDSVENEK